jgi:hypothetical protein
MIITFIIFILFTITFYYYIYYYIVIYMGIWYAVIKALHKGTSEFWLQAEVFLYYLNSTHCIMGA